MKTIVLTGGGTAGHVYPNLALKDYLKDEYIIHYIGGKGMEKDIISKEKDISYHQIETVKLERKLTLNNLLIPFKLFKAIRQCKKLLKEIKPNVIFSKGGFVAVPVVIAGKSLKIPIVSHESDLSLGLANKIILRCCDAMCCSFEKTTTYDKKCIYTGQPIRRQVLKGNKNNLNFLDKLNKNKPNLLVVGGSSGAKFINEKVIGNSTKLLENFNIIHITGRQKVKKIDKKGYVQVDYAENIGDFLNLADIVLSRAGSGAINEFLAIKKPMLLIPLSKKISRGDQIENANLFYNYKIADVLLEEDYDDNMFLIKINNLYKNREKYIKNMSKIQNFNACEKIIEIIKEKER